MYSFSPERPSLDISFSNLETTPPRLPYASNIQESDHRIEALLNQITILHETIHNLQRNKHFEIEVLKQKSDNITQLHVNNLKQLGKKEADCYESELRKLKEMVIDKISQNIQLSKTLQREKELFEQEINRAQSQVKEIIEKKNNEIFLLVETHKSQLKQQAQSHLEQLSALTESQKYQAELHATIKQQHEANNQALNEAIAHLQTKLRQQEIKMEDSLLNLEEKHTKQLEAVREYSYKMRIEMQAKYEVQLSQRESQFQITLSIYSEEINECHRRISSCTEQLSACQKSTEQMLECHGRQLQSKQLNIDELYSLLQRKEQSHQRSFEVLKVKTAILHQNDIKELVSLYELKLTHLSGMVTQLRKKLAQSNTLLNDLKLNEFNIRRSYQRRAEETEAKLKSLQALTNTQEQQLFEANSLEKDQSNQTIYHLQRIIQSQKQELLSLTSELKKVRELMEVTTAEHDRTQANLHQQLNHQTDRFDATEKQWEIEKKALQNQVDECRRGINAKDAQIRKLNEKCCQLDVELSQMNSNYCRIAEKQEQRHVDASNEDERDKQISELGLQLNEARVTIQMLCSKLESNYYQNLAYHEQMLISSSHSFKSVLAAAKTQADRQTQALLEEKKQLNQQLLNLQWQLQQVQSENQQISSKIKNLLTLQAHKSDLEQRVIHLGTDRNLVKNLRELFS